MFYKYRFFHRSHRISTKILDIGIGGIKKADIISVAARIRIVTREL